MKIIYQKNKEEKIDCFKNWVQYQGLFLVRKRVYKVIIIMRTYNNTSSEFNSFCKDVDSDSLLWDNTKNMDLKYTDGKLALQKELDIYINMFKEMESK